MGNGILQDGAGLCFYQISDGKYSMLCHLKLVSHNRLDATGFKASCFSMVKLHCIKFYSGADFYFV